jgi:predicted DNA-binding transcriptional regulator YafY
MSRTARLFDLMQLLRRHRHPVSGTAIAAELGISLRTLYRDMATLQAQGAAIDGAPGLGYVLKPGFTLPPLMFSADEVEALVLGSRWVADRGDQRLAEAARNALAKIAAVLPPELRHEADSAALLVGPGEAIAAGDTEVALIREAIRTEHKLGIRYRDGAGATTGAHDLAVCVGLLRPRARGRGLVRVAPGRSPLPHRPHRAAAPSGERYPQRRQALLKAWRLQQGIAEPKG